MPARRATTNGAPTTAKITASSREHSRRLEHERQNRPQRKRDVHRRQNHDEIRHSHQEIVRRTARVARDGADQRANEHRTECGDDREPH